MPKKIGPKKTGSQGNLLYAQSGGVTAVINATACAVIQACRRKRVGVYAARNGIIGALREELIDVSKEDKAEIAALQERRRIAARLESSILYPAVFGTYAENFARCTS